MTATLKHLNSYTMSPTTKILDGFSIAPAMQAVIVNRVAVVDPQFASIIRDELEVVTAAPENSQASGPACCKVITASEPRPSATSVAIVHYLGLALNQQTGFVL